ncbi:hypothetical protein ILUMI_22527 [Ignelater luminosus]|uniref:Uncharacterized protein n=1 Tax=Ignelater luminosus TaxID=2038154 RepID=A0A8K0C9Z6_IGNLU|nr:hypothetical protein ILUMI_22527 [Ignelater luminosus]
MCKRIVILELLLLTAGALTLGHFRQNDYSIIFERIQIDRYNKEYLRTAKIVTFKYNRTQPACNATFEVLKDFGNNLEVIIQAYTFLSNEYRTFPMRFSLDLCKVIDANDFGLGDIVQEGLFSGCPIKKGVIHVYNWKPNQSRFPPFIPNGQYKLEMEILYFSTEVFVMNAYGTVSRPLGRRH